MLSVREIIGKRTPVMCFSPGLPLSLPTDRIGEGKDSHRVLFHWCARSHVGQSQETDTQTLSSLSTPMC